MTPRFAIAQELKGRLGSYIITKQLCPSVHLAGDQNGEVVVIKNTELNVS